MKAGDAEAQDVEHAGDAEHAGDEQPEGDREAAPKRWLPALPDRSPAARSTTGHGPRWIALGVGAVVVVVVAAFMWASRSIDEPASRAPTGPSVIDTFTRDDAGAIGASDTGHTWGVVAGTWGVEDQQASVMEAGENVSLAVVDVRSGDMSAAATIRRMTPGAGLVFRYRGPLNHWAVQAAPAVGTWNVIKVVDGESEVVGNLGVAAVSDGTTIAMEARGSEINIRVNGTALGSFEGAELADATSVGLIALGAEATGARFDNFQASPLDLGGL